MRRSALFEEIGGRGEGRNAMTKERTMNSTRKLEEIEQELGAVKQQTK